jgi:hypothetical protein
VTVGVNEVLRLKKVSKFLKFQVSILHLAMLTPAIFTSCEQCERRAGMEQIQIYVSRAKIDSIKRQTLINFSESVVEGRLYYRTGWQHIESSELRINVYTNNVSTELVFPIVNDEALTIFIADTIEHYCSTLQNSRILRKNTVEACYRSEILPCP